MTYYLIMKCNLENSRQERMYVSSIISESVKGIAESHEIQYSKQQVRLNFNFPDINKAMF